MWTGWPLVRPPGAPASPEMMPARVFSSAGGSVAFRSPMRTHCPQWPWETSATNVCSPSPWHAPIVVESESAVAAWVPAAPDAELPGVSLVPAPPGKDVVWAAALASPAPLLPVLPLPPFAVVLPCPLAGGGVLASLSWCCQQL